MALWILFGICLVVEAVCTPWYLKALWPEKCTKSLVLKMVCSTMFVSIGVLSMFIADNFSKYAITMLVGLVLGWIGDYFLHAKPSNVYFVTGFVSFLVGHIFYIVAYGEDNLIRLQALVHKVKAQHIRHFPNDEAGFFPCVRLAEHLPR